MTAFLTETARQLHWSASSERSLPTDLSSLARPAGYSSRSMAKARILIVEDDASLAEVLEYNLSQEGYDVQVARDGQMGLREIRLRCPDLVVLDLMLPMIEGQQVRRRHATAAQRPSPFNANGQRQHRSHHDRHHQPSTGFY